MEVLPVSEIEIENFKIELLKKERRYKKNLKQKREY